MPRNYYQPDNTANYMSMFVPTNMDLINQNIQQSQQRFDTTVNSWAATKAKLLEEASFDDAAKQALLNRLESNFGDIRKSYDGDLGAAHSDVMNLIAAHRADPYFQLNRRALEQQKLQDAMVAQYGPEVLKFSTLPTSLRTRDADGNYKYINADALNFDIQKKMDWSKRAADIAKDSMLAWSKEDSHSTDGGKSIKSTTVYGIGRGGQETDKFKTIKEEYSRTAEHDQQMKVFKKLNGMTDAEAEAAMDEFLRDIIHNRVAPESSKIDIQKDPSYVDHSKDSAHLTFVRPTPSNESALVNRENYFPTEQSIIDEAGKNNRTTLKGRQAIDIMNNVVGNPELVTLRNQMRALQKEYGVTGEIYSLGKINIPAYNNTEYDEDIRRKEPGVQAIKSEKQKEFRIKFKTLADQYNNTLKSALTKYKTGDYPQQSQWLGFDEAANYTSALNTTGDREIAKKAGDDTKIYNDNLNNTFVNANFVDYDIIDAPSKNELKNMTADEKIKLQKTLSGYKPSDDGYRTVKAYNSMIKPIKVEWKVLDNEVVYKSTNENGDSFVIKPNNSTLAMKHAVATNDIDVITKTAAEFYRFTGDKYFTLEHGEETIHQMPYGLSVQKERIGDNTNGYFIKKDGKNIPIVQVATKIQKEQGDEAYSNYLNEVLQYYQNKDNNSNLSIKDVANRPAIMFNEYDLGKTFDIITE